MAKKKRRTKRVGKKKTTRKRKKKTSRKKKTGRSAGGVNKSEAIRTYFATNPLASPSKVVDVLGTKGIKVSSALVSQVKARGGVSKKRRRGRPARRTSRRKVRSNDVVSVSDLLEAKRLAARIGGIENARRALNALASLEATDL